MQKKIIIIVSILFVSILSLFLIGGYVYHTKEFGEEKTLKAYTDIEIVSNVIELVDSSEDIFICKVKNKMITTDRIGDVIPITHYNVKVIKYLKGDGLRNRSIKFLGGKRINNTLVYSTSNPSFLDEGKYYIIFLNVLKDNECIN